MVRKVSACLGLLMCLTVFSPVAFGDAVAAGSATIDWSSVTITAKPGTTITQLSYYSGVGTIANYNRPDQVYLQQSYSGGLDTNQTQTYDSATGNRNVSLSGSVDLANANKITTSASDRSNKAGSSFDITFADQWIYIMLGGAGELTVTGNYSLFATASAGQPGEWSIANPMVELWLFDEGTGIWWIRDDQMITASASNPFLPSDTQTLSGQFNHTVTAPTNEVLRLMFYAGTDVNVNSAAPVPEPSCVLLVGAGVLWLASCRRKK